MTSVREVALEHSALVAEPGGVPLAQARLTDQQRLAAVLQAAAVRAHLDHGGLTLRDGWGCGRWHADGRLSVQRVVPGPANEYAQVALSRLIRLLFRTEMVAGRGMARRAARRLLERWGQLVAAEPADRAVADVLELAPFLWQPAFAVARKGLAARHGASGLWVAGPGRSRRRLLVPAHDLGSLQTLLASDDAHSVWSGVGEPAEDPHDLLARGRYQQALIAWEQRPPRGTRSRLACGEAAIAMGRYVHALESLREVRGVRARILRARAQVGLNELKAARATLERLGRANLTGPETVQAAEVAVRVAGNLGRPQAADPWVARARASARGPWALRARVLAALAAWDQRDFVASNVHLEASRKASDEPNLAWRWHHARALCAQSEQNGIEVIEHEALALRHERRRLSRAWAGRLWNGIGHGRVMIDDLPGAERAFRHAYHLLRRCDGPAALALAAPNLAETQMRRGRLSGVAGILETSVANNRNAGNVRALFFDLVLWMRFELAHGRMAAAIGWYDEVRTLLDSRPDAGDASIPAVMMARAQGWLGRAASARSFLDSGGTKALVELEPEERPAVLALAGQMDESERWAHGTPWAALWKALAVGRAPSPRVWELLESLEPYRAARLVFDCEAARPGTVPAHRIVRAVADLRAAGAEGLAERLEGRSLSPWLAIEQFLGRAPSDGLEEMGALLERTGHSGAEIIFVPTGDREQGPRIVVAGVGGPKSLVATVAEGEIRLRAKRLDPMLRGLFSIIRRHLEPRARPVAKQVPVTSESGILGESEVLAQALNRLRRLAVLELPMLILGESGTGKELAARLVHRSSPRAGELFVAVNCAALPENLILSELFGHVRGAFTGADRDRAGFFESARGGSVFLDEIGDLPLYAQGMLLRVLQESEIRRVGESHSRRVDVRIVAATHRDLSAMVKEGSFREDLLFRLKVASVELPPLRDRGDDVFLLAEHFLRRQAGGRTLRLSKSARQRLGQHTWPGNVRELVNVLAVAAALSDDEVVSAASLDLPAAANRSSEGFYHQEVESLRRRLIERALDWTGGNRAAAARRLGLSRQALSYLVRQLGISRP